eukprot:365796-Chlamydomonas_euryale.AAC.8
MSVTIECMCIHPVGVTVDAKWIYAYNVGQINAYNVGQINAYNVGQAEIIADTKGSCGGPGTGGWAVRRPGK